MNQIKSWGIKNNLIEDSVIYYIKYYDDEYEETYKMIFTNKAEAEENAEEYAEYDVDSDTYTPSKVYIEKTIKGTEKLKKLAKQTGEIVDDNALHLLTTIYFESEGMYDGIWWNENLDVSRLSAPRGVIFNRKLKNWLVFKEVYMYAIYLMLNNAEKMKNTDKNWKFRHDKLVNIPTELRFKNENIFIEKIQKDRQIIYLVVGQNSIAICDYFNFNIYTTKNSSYSDMIQLLKKHGSKEIHRILELQKLK